ncbi:hypothetical protein [Corynebacterium sp. HS2168-gen11]|uniref:hypothetical protein n=1 Tax=Corynebacterium sp. HS2168-gen11 TaxID=2974027 RepID=UPI00216B2BD9|nr:hypothetical protein [Corynebacterium sp. HS2168-gen11]MCS4535880.1 hypothetical protein [Corynebacterium sp. HS2168-gen11]
MQDTPDFENYSEPLSSAEVEHLPLASLSSQLPQPLPPNIFYSEQLTTWEQFDPARGQAWIVQCETLGDVERILQDETGVVVGARTSVPEIAHALRRSCIPFEFDGPVAQQLYYGASRMRGVTELVEQFSIKETGEIVLSPEAAFIRDRRLPLIAEPAAALAAGEIESLADYPLAVLDSLGFEVSVDLLDADFIEAQELGLAQLHRLIIRAMEAAFVSADVRMELLTQVVNPAFVLDDASEQPQTDPQSQSESDALADQPDPKSSLIGVDPLWLAEMGIRPEDLGLTEA